MGKVAKVQFADSLKNEKIYLASVSLGYDERNSEKIKAAFETHGFRVNTTYLAQRQTALGYVDSEQNRAHNLIQALLDDQVTYIWFVKGGWGAFNIYPYLCNEQKKIAAAKPKILIGFSDVTAVHYYINNVIQWPSVHGVLALANKEMNRLLPALNINMESSILQVAEAIDKGVSYSHLEPMNTLAFKGARGVLSGGNMSVIQSFFNTKYEEHYRGKILLLEDVGIAVQQLDQSLHQLRYCENFYPEGVVFGQFYGIEADNNEQELYRYVIREFSKKVNYPVYYYPKFGHGVLNSPFILAEKAEIYNNGVNTDFRLEQPSILA